MHSMKQREFKKTKTKRETLHSFKTTEEERRQKDKARISASETRVEMSS